MAEGVDTRFIVRGGDRIGMYFTEVGASQRPSTVIYDRARSAISEMEPGTVDWSAVMSGAAWFHCTGITPALGRKAVACTREALEAAKAAGARVSMDLNYRKKLWSEAEAQREMRPLIQSVDVVIANEEDIQSVLGLEVHGAEVIGGTLNRAGYRQVAERVANEFQISQVAVTLRESRSASQNCWSAVLFDASNDAFHESQCYDITVVDRIGAGDSFAAG